MSTPTFEITTLPDQPFYTGPGIREPEETALPVAIDGRGFLLDFSSGLGLYHSYQRSAVQLLNSQQSDSGDDAAQIPPEVWRRNIETWSGGAGQERYDRKNSLPNRFSDCHNVDVWTDWRVSLLPAVTNISSVGSGRSWVLTVGPDQMVVIAGTYARWWTDLTGDPTVDGLAGTALGACTDGTLLYVLSDDGHVYSYPTVFAPTVFASIPGLDPGRSMIAYVKGFLIVGNQQYLYDITTGTPVLIYQHPNPTFTWRDASDGQAVAYLIGGSGDRWAVYRMSPKDDATTFDPPVQAGPLPDGEIATAIGTYLNFVMVGVDTGWRFAAPDSTGNLTYGQIIKTGTPVYDFEGQESFIWYSMGADPDHAITAGLGRANLATFINDLTPAHAPDLSTDAVTGNVWSITTFHGKRVFTVGNSGVWAEQDELATDGWLDQGALSFNTSDPKQGLYVQVYHRPLFGEIDVDVNFDEEAWGQIGHNDLAGSVTMGHLGLDRAFSNASIRYRLYRDEENPTLGPTLTRMEFRVLPVSAAATEFRLPIILSDQYTYADTTQQRSVAGDYDLLIELGNTKRPFQYREGARTYTLHATDFLFLGHRLDETESNIIGTFVLVAREVD
jgi:hypothetical protein